MGDRRQRTRRAEDGPLKFTCPHCGGQTSSVVDSRGLVVREEVKRRRECGACGCRWTTRERIDPESITVPEKVAATLPVVPQLS